MSLAWRTLGREPPEGSVTSTRKSCSNCALFRANVSMFCHSKKAPSYRKNQRRTRQNVKQNKIKASVSWPIRKPEAKEPDEVWDC